MERKTRISPGAFCPLELRENPSTYFVEDRSNLNEMARLEIQDKMLTLGMGGVLPELADPTSLRRVLDVGCGTGGWLMETALTYPTIEKLFGGDISGKILAYARRTAESLGLDGRVQFKTMDALRMLEFPDGSFDLVNQRLGASWLRQWDWKKLFVEYYRVTRPGGIIRITECNVLVESNSPALTKLCDIALEASYHSGRLFTPSSDGVTGKLAHLMTRHAIQDVQTQVYTLVYRVGTETGRSFYEDMLHLFRVALPFFNKYTRIPGNYEEIYQQALKEMQRPDFAATWVLRTAWGMRPMDGQKLFMRGLR